MTGLPHSPLAKAAGAVASVIMSIMSTPSYADNADQIAIAREGGRSTTQYSARPRDRAFTNEARSSNECIGGYRWRIQEINSNLTDDQQSLPLPC